MILKIVGIIVALVLANMFLWRERKICVNEWSVVAWMIIGFLVIGIWIR